MTTINTDWMGYLLESGRFQVGRKLAEGGMAVVYGAVDLLDKSKVVIKVPKPSVFEDASLLRRFAKESQALMSLSHPHIVRIRHVGNYDGWPYTVMDYLAGGDLDVCRQAFGGRLTLMNISRWAPPIAKALDFIHSRGYLHRDVKPSNILFDGQGRTYLGDFGIAKALGNPKETRLTGKGQLPGTPDYMAPEFVMGHKLDGRADQYALAITIYECLAGHPPFEEETPGAVLVLHSTQVPRPLSEVAPEVPQGVSDVIRKALAKAPQKRFPTCSAMVGELLHRMEAPVLPAPAAMASGQKLPSPKTTQSSASSHTEVHSRQGKPSSRSAANVPPVVRRSASPIDEPPQHQKPRGMWKELSIVAAAVFGVLLSATLWWLFLGPKASDTKTQTDRITENSNESSSPKSDAPSPPDVKNLPTIPVEFNEGEKWSMVLADSISESLRAGASYEPESELPESCFMNPLTGQVVWTPDEGQGPDESELKFLVKDAKGQAFARLTYAVQIKEVNQPPTLQVPAKIELKLGQNLRTFLSATDPDLPANTLRFELVKPDPKSLSGLRIDPETGRLFWDKTAASAPPAGWHKVTIRVSDDALDSKFAEDQVELSFLNIELAEVDLTSVKEGQLVRVPITAKLPGEPDAQFTYKLMDNSPEGSQVDEQTGEFRWTVPRDAGGKMQTVQLEIAKSDDPTLKRIVQFQVTVQKAADVKYVDLPELPKSDDVPEAFVFEDFEVAPGTKLKLLGYDKQLLESDDKGPSISWEPNRDASQVVAFYEKPKGSLNDDLEKKEPVSTFRVAGTKLEFEWEAYKDREIRPFKELLRDAVLQVEIPGKPTQYLALQSPAVASPQEVAKLLSEPYEDDSLHRGNSRPTRCRRRLQFENVKLHWMGKAYLGNCTNEGQVAACSFPDAAQELGFDQLQFQFEDQAGKLVWQCDTSPSVRKAYEEFASNQKQLASVQTRLTKSVNAYQKNRAAVNGILNSSRKKLPQLLASLQNKTKAAFDDAVRYDLEAKKLKQQTALAHAKYAPLRSQIKPAAEGTLTLSVYRTVEGLRIDVLRIE